MNRLETNPEGGFIPVRVVQEKNIHNELVDGNQEPVISIEQPETSTRQ